MINPPVTELTSLSIKQLSQAYQDGQTDPLAVTNAYLSEIKNKNTELNAYLVVTSEAAISSALASTQRLQSGRTLSPIDGIPIALKDNIDLLGIQTTNGCKFGPVPKQDAQVVKRLKAAGAIILGKLNQHELALGTTTNNPHFGPAHNPVRTGVTPGGSSGGSGVAVAAKMAVAALGTDTMGSVRIPAAYCGCFGIKPTFGLISNNGVSPLARALDHVGPLARNPADLELMLRAMTNSSLNRVPFELKGLKVGRVKEIDEAETHHDMASAYHQFLRELKEFGANIVEISWPNLKMSRARLAGLLLSEVDAARAYSDDLLNRPDRFSPEIRAMISYGRDAAQEKIKGAESIVSKAGDDVNASFNEVDVIVTPTAPMPAFEFSETPPPNQADFTAPANFAGCPAISIPRSKNAEGLPIGVQIMAAKGRDIGLIRLAQMFAKA